MPKKKRPEEIDHKEVNPNVMGLHAAVVAQPITDTLEVNYMPYAMSVIVSRAIPEIDGFKPSHRKLLYTMYKMGLLTGARTKSANIVGQTMRLNPHGDAAIYDTMVRLSVGYGALLTPFVDSKGNFGKSYSRDMAWAASRYTEAKLAPICAEIFKDIDNDTVDFIDNYDNTMKEPALLPTTFPNILVSANSGIAVGMASQFCGFNLKEVCDTTVAYLKNPDCALTDTLLGPDFPTGGELICEPAALEEIYRTGRGGVKVRAKWRYVKDENLIEIYEIPYSTSIEAILDKVAELIKAGKIKEIADMRDETDRSGLKLTIDLKRGVDPDRLMAKLFKQTTLQDTCSCNFNVLIAGMPKVLGVRQLLEEWCAWRRESVRRRVYFVLGKKKDKLHLLKGLKRILLDIDKAIKIIRETAEEAEVIPNLMIGFGIDQTQAEYVAEIKLRNINKEYILKRVQETDALQDEIEDLEDLLESPQRLKKVIISELNEVSKKYGQPRRTTLIYSHEVEVFDEEDTVEDYPVSVFLSREGYFKKIPPASLRMNSEQKYKDGDTLRQTFETSNASEIMFFTDRCQVYKCRICDFEDLKASVLGDYLPTKLGMDPEESPVFACLPRDYSGALLFFFENGKAARVNLTAYQTTSNRRKLTGAYSDKSPLAAICHLNEEEELALYSSEPRALIFSTALLTPKTTRSTQGVAVMTMKPKYHLEKAVPLAESAIVNQSRYRVRSVPAAGSLLRGEDSEEKQIGLLD
ncbi:MAG: DNA topoisomerase (ATP-hydrolyzing) subunit A [Oscillibacter ruminantium]|uniref:DNA topoisomerase (ATP-hydrolyzing) subunit A n=1 Tax=Oscillibacter ruminantium TaxID=1263547 RepID=UPI002B1FC878|nr:DNA topoisomerase (ATP-hydrolyzing) subunit A [Oscillibacter ruminantium]MEA5041821.1 DNA topoisomerase (ATP-hydrolyzing) subunit A [Oscillibacter ruminantium]